MIRPIVRSLEVALQSENIHAHVETLKNDLSKLIIDNVTDQTDGLYATVYDFEELLTSHILSIIADGPTKNDIDTMKDLAEVIDMCQTLIKSVAPHKEGTLANVSDFLTFKQLQSEAVEFELILIPYV